ncbi:MAG: LysR family transcriptional regulator [Oricola sp.]
MDTVASMRAFVRVVELGGLSQAARDLAISPGMVAKHVANLEARTGARLLDRTTRSVRPTPAGQAYYDKALVILEGIDEAEGIARADTSELRGTLRLTAPVEFGQAHLAPLIAAFLTMHPRISISADFTNRKVDLVQEGVDLAIRIAAALDSSLIGRKLATSRFHVVASPDCVARHGAPETPGDLTELPTLSFSLPEPRLDWPWSAGGAEGKVRVNPRLLSSSSETLRLAAVAGAGFTWLPSFVCGRDVAEGRLVEVLPGFDWSALAIHALYSHRRFVPVRLRAFMEFIAKQLSDGPGSDPWAPARGDLPAA